VDRQDRGTPTPGVGLISPPPHHDIYSIEDLAELIHDLKNANRTRASASSWSPRSASAPSPPASPRRTPTWCSSAATTAARALRRRLRSSTPACPWELGLAETHQTLVLNNLRSRIAVETDGQLKTGRDVVIAALLGAEEFGFATAPLVALGCIMMRVCHLNTCPVGRRDAGPALRKKFTGKPEHVVNFMRFIAQECASSWRNSASARSMR
jgi:glutamate synthase domain-containing protein 2